MQQPIVGPGLCECGCGQVTPIAARTFGARGVVKGQPFRFARGHRLNNGPIAFWDKVPGHLPSDACWPWLGYRNPKGYGSFGPRRAASLIYETTHGLPVGDLHVLHTCDNPPCVNPAHLFLGTNADNVADRVAKGRTPAAANRALSMEQASEIRRDYANGSTQRTLSERFGISRPSISMIVNGHTYR